MAITQAFTASFKVQLLQGVHNLNSDTFYLALYTSNSNINSATTVYTTTGETSGTGYTAGGALLTNLGVTLSGTTAFASWAPVSWTNATFSAAGGLIYNASKGNAAVAVLNFGGIYSVSDDTFEITFPAYTSTTAPIIQY
jgi:hypothetical protein